MPCVYQDDMSDQNQQSEREPLGKELTYLSRLYYGVVTNKLSALEIERYYYVLVLIKEGQGKLTQKELASRIHSDKVFTVKILDYLSEKGMIRRMINKDDRREHLICLTAKGEKQVPLITKAFNEATAAAFKGLSKAEKELYYTVLHKMRENLLSLPADEVKVNFKKIKKSKK